MARPLPPVPVGPIFPSSPFVQVTGSLPGAEVRVMADGRPVGRWRGAVGTTWVPVSGALRTGQLVSAAQATSDGESAPSTIPIKVAEAPNPPDPPAFWSALSEAMAYVWLGQLIPGAEVTLTVKASGRQVARQTAARTDEYVALDLNVPLNVGDVLVAVQKLGIRPAAPTSTPIESIPLFKANKEPPPPQVVQPLQACQTSLQFFMAAPSGEVKVSNKDNSNQSQESWWLGVDAAFAGYDAPPLMPGILEVHEEYVRFKLKSETAKFAVSPPSKPPPPEMANLVCHEIGRLGCRKLVPGAILQIFTRVSPTGESPGASGSESLLGEAGVYRSEQWFDIPPASLPAQPAGGSVWVSVRQSLCGQVSDEFGQNPVFWQRRQIAPPTIVGLIYDCATQVPVDVSDTLPTYQALRDDGTPLSDPMQCFDPGVKPRLIVNLYRPLHAGQTFHVEAVGCVAISQSLSVTVQPLPSPLPQPVFAQPIRPGATILGASDIVPGARVHLYINGQWLTSAKTLEKTIMFGVSPLADGDRVTAVQALCNQRSTNEPKPAIVTRGRMAVGVQPNPVVRGSHTAVTVKAEDADTGTPVVGAVVSLNGAMVGVTGQAFTFSPPLGLVSAVGVITDPPAHQDAAFTIALTDPLPQPKPTTQVTLNLGGYPVVNPMTPTPLVGTVSAQDIKWTVVPQWGGMTSVTSTGAHATVILPALPGGQALIRVFLDFTVVADGYVNGYPFHQSAPSLGVNDFGGSPSIFDLNQAPMHVIGFYEVMDIDQNGTPRFYAKAFGAQ